MKATSVLAAVVLALGAGAAGAGAAASNPAGWNGQDGWLVWKTLEPAATSRCAARDCPAWSGGLAPYSWTPRPGMAGRNWRTSAPAIRSTTCSGGCAADKTGCTGVELFFSTTNSISAEALKAYRAGKPACQVEATERLGLVGSVRLIVTQPLKPATTLAALQAARAKVVGCAQALIAAEG